MIVHTEHPKPAVRRSPRMPWTLAGNLANLSRLILAVLWTLLWGTARWIRYACRLPGHFRPYNCRKAGFSWGRRSCPKPMLCEDCGWVGPLRYALHTYRDDGAGDIECSTLCPRCNRDSLEPALSRGGNWTS